LAKEEQAKEWLQKVGMRTHQFTLRESAPPGLVAFRARILAAVPGKSLNGRIYTRELLKQTAPLYPSSGVNPRPFILDHDIEHAERVAGLITGASYGVQEAMDGRPVEGLWLEALGYMDDKLFAKMSGSKMVPAFVRGVSIGGEGEGEFTGDGVLIRRFQPAELSVTAFPGIPMAHVAELNRIREHYLNHSDTEVSKSSTFQIQEKDVSLEEAEKQKVNDARDPRKIREAQLLGPDKGYNDNRPGLPKPTVRSTVVHQVPQATTSSTSGIALNPEDSTASREPSSTARGASTYGRLKGNSPTEAAPGTAADAGAQGSRDARAKKIKIPKTGATTTTHPGPGKLSPSGTGMDSEEEEEEEAVQDLGNQDSPLKRADDVPASHTDLGRARNKAMAMPGENPHAKDGDEEEEERQKIRQDSKDTSDDDSEEEEEEEEEAEEHGPSGHIPGNPVGKYGKHAAKDAYDSPSEEEEEEETQRIRQHDEPVGVTPRAKPGTDSSDDRPEEEEEEEDGVSIDPLRKVAGQGQNLHANPTREESQPKVLFSEAEAIQARAFSLPSNSGILATLAAMAGPAKAKEAMAKGSVEELVNALTRPQHYMSKDEAAKLIEAWNKGKIPKEQKMRKIVMGKAAIGRSADLSVPDARRPAVDESVVRTRSITGTAPTFAGTSISTIPTRRLEELLEEEKKKPYSNVSYLNAAKRAWHRAVQDMIQFR